MVCVASQRVFVRIPFLFNTYLKMAMLFLGSEPQEAEELDPARGLQVAPLCLGTQTGGKGSCLSLSSGPDHLRP